MDEIVNKVANSPLVTLDLQEFRPEGERLVLDIAGHLHEGIILREKDFREFIRSNDWSTFKGMHVAITCSVDAIVPTWAFMLVASALQPFTQTIVFGTLEELEASLMRDAISKLPEDLYKNKKIVVKGCGKNMPVSAYIDLMNKIRPLAASIMYGEPCSTVPLYKQKKPSA